MEHDNHFIDINAPNQLMNNLIDINAIHDDFQDMNINNFSINENKSNQDNKYNLFSNDNKYNLNQNSKIEKKDYLQIKDWDYLDDNNIFIFEEKINKIIKNININELKNLQKSISEATFEYVYQNPDNAETIGPISSVGNLVEFSYAYDSTFKEDMIYHFIELEKYIFKWRNIDVDGNCFYRAVIFSFLENIILTNNILLLKEFIVIFNEKISFENPIFSNNTFINCYYDSLNIPLIMQILYTILHYLDKENGIKYAYRVLLKTFLYCKPFDYGMVFFLRYLIFEFINDNNNKFYSENFPIKLGCLLPDQYIINENNFNFNKFYIEHVMKMGIYAEKIIIYLVPYVLKCNLNILLYNFDKNDKVIIKSFNCPINDKFTIELFFRATHYDIIYNSQYYSLFKQYLMIYQYQDEKFKVIDNDYLQSVKKGKLLNNNNNNDLTFTCINCRKISKIVYKNLFLCQKCLLLEVKNILLMNYIQFLVMYTIPFNKIHQNLNKTFEQTFSSQICKIKNIEFKGNDLINLVNQNFSDLLQEIKLKICVQCQNEMKDKKGVFTLPCGCNLCSHNCYYTYFNNLMVNEVNIIKKNPELELPIFSSCYCGIKFTINNYLFLLNEFSRFNVDNFVLGIIEVIKNNFLKFCCFCLKKTQNDKNSFIVSIKDDYICNLLNVLNIKHICCNECIKNYQDNQKFFCKLCEREQIQLSLVLPEEN